ncbi:MAG: VOC family protein, partial [Dehalococcoidia bacterium]|nr:VOC family protein [Dehalococcoidia bacterium]
MPQFYYDHDHIYSPDPQKTVEWYMRVFGAKKTGETKTPRMNLIHMDINGAHLIVAGPFQG